MTEPIEMITVGRREYVAKWVMDGYEKLVSKKEVISEGESEAIGDRTAVKLYIVRHELASDLKEVSGKQVESGHGREGWLNGKLRQRFVAEFEVLEREEKSRRTEEEKQAKERLQGEPQDAEQALDAATQKHLDDDTDVKVRKVPRKKVRKLSKAAVDSSTLKEEGVGHSELEGGDSTKVSDSTVVEDTRHGLTQLPDSSLAIAIDSGGCEAPGWPELALTEEQKQRFAEIAEQFKQIAETFKQQTVKWDSAVDRHGKSTEHMRDALRKSQEGR